VKAIILAAGQGRRLMPLTAQTPKSAVLVEGRTMLEWQLRELSQTEVDEVVVVTGFAPEAVERVLERVIGLRVRAVHNPFFAHADNLGTCWAARAEFDAPCMIINGDTLFEASVARTLLDHSDHAPITLATDRKAAYDADDMKVVTRADRLLRVGKHLGTAHVNGESIGMMVFRGGGPQRFRHKVEQMMRREDGLRQWYLAAIDALAREDHVAACCIRGQAWCEVDDRRDLEVAAALVRRFAPLPAAAEA